MVRWIVLSSFLLLPALSHAQFRDKAELGGLEGIVLNPGVGINSVAPLLDPSRMSWSHSVQMGYAGGGGGSVGSGLFLNQLDYRLSQTMDFSLQLGVRSLFHNSYQPGATGDALIGGAEFSWQPTESFRMHISASRGLPSRNWYGSRGWADWDLTD